MKQKKKYILMLSRYFPKHHPRKGSMTGFEDILLEEKVHTIRVHVPYWERAATEINAGRAVLSIRCWTGRPYKSSQIEIARLTRLDTQRIIFKCVYCQEENISFPKGVEVYDHGLWKPVSMEDVAYNDGLSLEDFQGWFSHKCAGDVSAVILHFTDFRY